MSSAFQYFVFALQNKTEPSLQVVVLHMPYSPRKGGYSPMTLTSTRFWRNPSNSP